MKKKISAFFIALATAISFLIPKQFKRLVVISTLYKGAAEQKIFQHVDFNKLNQGMQLASNKQAIESAVHLTDAIWKDVDLNKLLQNVTINELDGERIDITEAQLISDRIIANVPKWLLYNREEMRKDVTFLFCVEPVSVCHA